MTDSSRVQGGLICAGVVLVGLLFLLGLLARSYWALAIPVALLVAFVLGLTFWVGWTIATIRVEPADTTAASPAATEPGTPAPPGAQPPTQA